jgi:signal transduction histidine kinase
VYANRQLALFNKRISEYRLIAEEALQSKSDFVARVSHEFRTPLNIIIGLVELMVETPEIYDLMPSSKLYYDLQVVYRNSEHLAKMINDILDLTRTEAGQLSIHRERQDLHKIIESAMIAVHPLLENKKLNWSISIPDHLPDVYCDGVRIEQVILNLVSNAIRHTNQGSISVTVIQKDQYIWLSVADTGTGISPEDVKRIFEPFIQSTGQLGLDKGGSGLGLSISKQIVELSWRSNVGGSELGRWTIIFFGTSHKLSDSPYSQAGYQIMQDLVWSERKSRFQFPDSQYKPRVVILDELALCAICSPTFRMNGGL